MHLCIFRCLFGSSFLVISTLKWIFKDPITDSEARARLECKQPKPELESCGLMVWHQTHDAVALLGIDDYSVLIPVFYST